MRNLKKQFVHKNETQTRIKILNSYSYFHVLLRKKKSGRFADFPNSSIVINYVILLTCLFTQTMVSQSSYSLQYLIRTPINCHVLFIE